MMIIVGGIILAVAVFAGRSLFRDDKNSGNTEQVPSIASIAAPDVHSLLIDPNDLDHVLFGSHSGIQESRDGGFTWHAGTLKNADAMSMAVSPNAPQTLYTVGHDVFQISSDGGQSWQALSPNLPSTDIHAFTQDPKQPERLFAFVMGAGVYRSDDGGKTWQELPVQPGEGSPSALASNGDALYATTQFGITVSLDHGASWTPLPNQPSGVAISLVAPASNPELLYAGTLSGLAKSTDRGQSWSTVGQFGYPTLALMAAPSNPHRVIAITQTGAVYRSDDGGESWIKP
jgi:photosystem II stability/assembly factor-like uncharacterized protein